MFKVLSQATVLLIQEKKNCFECEKVFQVILRWRFSLIGNLLVRLLFFLPTDEAFGDQCTGLELGKVTLPVRAKEPGEGASPHAWYWQSIL